MSMKTKLSKAVSALALAAGLVLPVSSEAATYTVNNWNDFQTDINSGTIQTGDSVIFIQNDIINVNGIYVTIPAGMVINLDGNNATIDENNAAKMFKFLGDIDSVSNITMINGGNTEYGGAIEVSGNLLNGISKSTFTNNAASQYGGAISIVNSLTGGVNESTFIDNTAGEFGGAIYADCIDNIHGSIFTGNKAASFDGGAIYIYNDLTGSITNSTFTNNTAQNSGGAIALFNLIGGISNSIFKNNSGGFGGALEIQGNLTGGIKDSTFDDNKATSSNGGAIRLAGNLTGGITGSSFNNNEAAGKGGAILAYSIDSISNSTFINNTAATGGGAIMLSSIGDPINLTLDSTGSGVLFQGNTNAGSPNSICYNLSNGNGTLNITGTGTLSMYDPLATINSNNTNTLTINQTSGTWILGGANDTEGSAWNINGGTLILTDDSPQTSNSSIKGDDFSLAPGANLFIVPNTTKALIDTTTASLTGTVGIVSDERYRDYIDPANFSDILLTVSATGFDNTLSTINQTSGSFALGQYNYTYEGLTWEGNDLVYRITSSSLDSERNGVYAANAPLHSALANPTNKAVFNQMSRTFGNLDFREKYSSDLWAIFLNNNIRTDGQKNNAGSSVNTPGIIIGCDRPVSNSSFLGVAVSAAWPDYKQGGLKADGKEIRFAVYGGSRLKRSWELGYLASVGFGDMKHDRSTSSENLKADYDTKNYNLGLSLAKNIKTGAGKNLRPFLTYEFIRSKADGYTETGGTATGITAGNQKNNLSRVRLGAEMIRESKRGSYLLAGMYWQGLYGDREARVTSYLTSTPGSLVRLTGAGLDVNSLGIDLTWGRKMGKTDLSLSYNGLFGKNSTSNTFYVNFVYSF